MAKSAEPADGARETSGHRATEQVATVVAMPFTLARQLLPDNPVPVALGAGALAVAGMIEGRSPPRSALDTRHCAAGTARHPPGKAAPQAREPGPGW